jgi:predicted DNA-binding transcriptional regulator AlpA
MSPAKVDPPTAPAPPAEDDDLLTIKQVSEMLGCSVQALYNLRHRGAGPKSFMLAGRIRYRRGAVRNWITEAEAADHTSKGA